MFVPIILGSRKDVEHAELIVRELRAFGIASEIRIASAHKATKYLLDVLAVYDEDPRPKVYITVAGRSNALSGVVDANVAEPVIACPPYSDRFVGADVFSSLRMPSGLAPAVVLEPEAAALLTAKIFALRDPALRKRIAEAQRKAGEEIKMADEAVKDETTGE